MRDEFTGLKIHAKRLSSESIKQITEVLTAANQRKNIELNSKVIISDAHPKQRKAIADVFSSLSLSFL